MALRTVPAVRCPNFNVHHEPSVFRSSVNNASAPVTNRAAASTASAPSSLLAIWALFPSNVTVTSREAANKGPGREAMTPWGKSGHRWQPQIASTRFCLKIPDSQMSLAPPVVSSAG